MLWSKLNQALFPFWSCVKCQFVQMWMTWLGPWPIVGTGGTALSANWLTVLRDQCADLPLRYRTIPPPPCTHSPLPASPQFPLPLKLWTLNCSFHFHKKLFSLSLPFLLPFPSSMGSLWRPSVCCGQSETEYWLRCSVFTPSLGEKCQAGSFSSLSSFPQLVWNSLWV